MDRIKSGVYGLNTLMDGGINASSSTVVIGSSGAGKTTMAMQFLRRGLEYGQDGVYLTLDEPPEQLIREAREMGWTDITDYIDEDLLVFIDASGREFTKFVKEELADFVEEWRGADARLVIDPLTPVIWSVHDPADQRDLISFLLRQCKRMGTVVCTLEEHGTLGNLSGPETITPMYLSDNVIHLRYVATNDLFNREIKVVKSRSSRHSRVYHPYEIVKGAGIIIKSVSTEMGKKDRVKGLKKSFKTRVAKLPKAVRTGKAPQIKRIARMLDTMEHEPSKDIDNGEFIELALREYEIV